jgi:hypothetical protein
MPADTDYVIFFVVALLAVVGAGLLRVGLMKSRGRLFIALGIAFGTAAVLILVLRTVKIGG